MGNTQTRIAGFSTIADAHSGGVFIRAINQDDQSVFDTQMTSAQDVAQIPNGTWLFNIISFNGPTYMKGTKNCGSSQIVELEGNPTTVTMSINSLSCGNSFFQSFANDIGARNSFFMQLGNITTAAGGSNAGSDFCNSIATDANGFVYCGGQTNGSLGETSGGGFDAFILKADQQGNIIWLKQLGATTIGAGASGNDYCFSIVVNSSGDIYCAGKTSGNLGDTNAGSFDAFVIKLNSSGALTWITQVGISNTLSGTNSKSGNDTCNSIALDSSENIICGGSTTSSLVETNGGAVDIFVMKLDPGGTITWLTQLGSTTNAGGSNTGNDLCNSVAVDSSDNIYCAGYTTGGPGSTDGNAGGGGDIAIYKFDPSGTILSMVQFGDTTGYGSNTGFDACNSVAVDSNDNVYCGGSTTGDFGEATNTGTSDAFIAKFDSILSPIWLTQLGSTTIAPGGNNTAGDNCKSIAVGPNDNIYCAGFTEGNQGELNSNSLSDTTIFKLDSSGSLQWLHQFGSESNAGGDNTAADKCYGVALDNNGNIFCGGFTDGSMGTEANAGTSDIIIYSLDEDGGF